jgi:hypothetical protein
MEDPRRKALKMKLRTLNRLHREKAVSYMQGLQAKEELEKTPEPKEKRRALLRNKDSA